MVKSVFVFKQAFPGIDKVFNLGEFLATALNLVLSIRPLGFNSMSSVFLNFLRTSMLTNFSTYKGICIHYYY